MGILVDFKSGRLLQVLDLTSSTNQNRYTLSGYSTTTITIPQQFGIHLIRVLDRHFDGLISASRNTLLKLLFNFLILL